MPEYERLPAGDPVAGLMSLLERGPRVDGHETFVPAGSFAGASEQEGMERRAIELGSPFWDLPQGERFAAAAQIVFTLATVEGGHSLLLLDGTVPGEILDGSSQIIEQPLDRSDFAELEPWVQVAQPVAGAAVGEQLVVDLDVRDGRATCDVEQNGRLLASGTTEGETLVLNPSGAVPGDLELSIRVRSADGTTHVTRLPLRFAG